MGIKKIEKKHTPGRTYAEKAESLEVCFSYLNRDAE